MSIYRGVILTQLSQTMVRVKQESLGANMSDAHCHLDLFDSPQDAVAEATGRGVSIIITAGGSRERNVQTWKLSGMPNVYGVIGIDPEAADEEDEYFEELEYMVKSSKRIVGFGEIGLDSTVKAGKERQVEVFSMQLKLAKKLDMPVVIHSRGMLADVVDMLDEHKMPRVMFHYFEGDEKQAAELAGKGWLISMPPIESGKRKRIINEIDLINMVTETDSPVVGKTPADVSKVIDYIARIKDVSPGEVAEQTTKNVKGFFGI